MWSFILIFKRFKLFEIRFHFLFLCLPWSFSFTGSFYLYYSTLLNSNAILYICCTCLCQCIFFLACHHSLFVHNFSFSLFVFVYTEITSPVEHILYHFFLALIYLSQSMLCNQVTSHFVLCFFLRECTNLLPTEAIAFRT